MATDKNTLKKWFRNKLKPPQEQFWAWINSYWHKDEQIPVTKIEGLDKLLEGAVTIESLNALVERVELLENAPRKGVQSDEVIEIAADRIFKYDLPNNAMLVAFVIQANATVEVGSDEQHLGDLGEIESRGKSILNFGLIPKDSIYIRTNATATVTPIIYVE